MVLQMATWVPMPQKVITMWEFIVCPKDTHFNWHVQDCVFGDCECRGVDNLALCPIEEDGSSFAVVY